MNASIRIVMLAAWLEFEAVSNKRRGISTFWIGGARGIRPTALASLPRLELGRLGIPKLGVSGPRSIVALSVVAAVVGGPESRDSKALNALAVGLGAVLLRLRLWYLRMTGGIAASFNGSYCSIVCGLSYSDIVGIPSVVNDLNGGRAFDPLAILIESRIGLLLRDPPSEAAGLVLMPLGSSEGKGGIGARSFMLMGECDKNESAVNQI